MWCLKLWTLKQTMTLTDWFPIIDSWWVGYVIPAGWKVLPILGAVHLDPSHHVEPEQFQPCRWEVCVPWISFFFWFASCTSGIERERERSLFDRCDSFVFRIANRGWTSRLARASRRSEVERGSALDRRLSKWRLLSSCTTLCLTTGRFQSSVMKNRTKTARKHAELTPHKQETWKPDPEPKKEQTTTIRI
jgi:hypothetical protein